MNGEYRHIFRLLVIVLTCAVLIRVPSLDAQGPCDSPVPHVKDPGEVSVFVPGVSSSTGTFTPATVSHLNYHEMTNNTFSGIFAGVRQLDARVGFERGTGRTVRLQYVSGIYFQVLEVAAKMGRVFQAAEDRPEDNLAIAVISDALWGSMFQFDPDAVGRSVMVDGRRVTIIGIMPPGFLGVLQTTDETMWLPGASMPGADNRSSEGYTYFVVRPSGPTLQETRRYFSQLPARLVEAFPDVNQKFKTVTFQGWPLNCLRQ